MYIDSDLQFQYLQDFPCYEFGEHGHGVSGRVALLPSRWEARKATILKMGVHDGYSELEANRNNTKTAFDLEGVWVGSYASAEDPGRVHRVELFLNPQEGGYEVAGRFQRAGIEFNVFGYINHCYELEKDEQPSEDWWD